MAETNVSMVAQALTAHLRQALVALAPEIGELSVTQLEALFKAGEELTQKVRAERDRRSDALAEEQRLMLDPLASTLIRLVQIDYTRLDVKEVRAAWDALSGLDNTGLQRLSEAIMERKPDRLWESDAEARPYYQATKVVRYFSSFSKPQPTDIAERWLSHPMFRLIIPRPYYHQIALDGKTYYMRLRSQALADPDLEEEVFVAAAVDPDVYLRRSMVKEIPHLPSAALAILADDEDVTVVKGVADHANTSPDDLRRLAGHPDRSAFCVAARVARNAHTPPDVLEELAAEFSTEVAANPSTPISLLERWVAGRDGRLHGVVATNPSCPSYLLRILAANPDSSIRGWVARHHNTEDETLAKLAHDRSSTVRSVAIAEQKRRLASGGGEVPSSPTRQPRISEAIDLNTE